MGAVGNAYSDFNRSVGVSKDSEIFGQFKRGNYGKGIVNIAYGAPGWEVAQDLLSGPKRQVLGGSQEALDARRAQYAQGVQQGQAVTQAGLGAVDQAQGYLGAAAGQAGADRGMAQTMYGTGMGIGGMGVLRQQDAIQQARAMAMRDTGSVAESLMQAGLGQTQRGMYGQAAQARGGNQAAAIRMAQRAGAQQALDVNSQIGVMRRQEAVDRLNRQLAVEDMAAQAGGQQAGLGYGVAGQGLGYALQGTGQLAGIGSSTGELGLGTGRMGLDQQGLYVNAGLDADKAQLDYDARLAGADVQRKAGIIGGIASGASKMFGGM